MWTCGYLAPAPSPRSLLSQHTGHDVLRVQRLMLDTPHTDVCALQTLANGTSEPEPHGSCLTAPVRSLRVHSCGAPVSYTHLTLPTICSV
eukprot:1406696-Alexandrium_andersonii.AAC.1